MQVWGNLGLTLRVQRLSLRIRDHDIKPGATSEATDAILDNGKSWILKSEVTWGYL